MLGSKSWKGSTLGADCGSVGRIALQLRNRRSPANIHRRGARASRRADTRVRIALYLERQIKFLCFWRQATKITADNESNLPGNSVIARFRIGRDLQLELPCRAASVNENGLVIFDLLFRCSPSPIADGMQRSGQFQTQLRGNVLHIRLRDIVGMDAVVERD